MDVVCVIGASGFIGQHFVKLLSNNKEVQLRLLVHRHTSERLRGNKRISFIKGDLLDPSSLKQLVIPGSVVVNLAYLKQLGARQNIRAADAIIQACEAGGAKRLVHCSTADVFGRINNRIIDESLTCRPMGEYETTKFEIEQFFLNKSRSSVRFDIVIVRPTAVFGPGGQNLIKLARELMNGSTLVNYFKSCIHGNRRMNAVYVDNVTACISFLSLINSNIDRQVFLISDDESSNNNYRFIETVFLRKFGRRDYVIPRVKVPGVLLSLALKVRGRSNFMHSRVYSCEKLLKLGFRKPVSFELGLFELAEWYKRSHAS